MIPVRQFPDGRVSLRVADAERGKDGVLRRWFTVDVTRGVDRINVEAMTDGEVAVAVALVPYSVDPSPHDGAAGSTDYVVPPLLPDWHGPFEVGDFVAVSKGVLGVDSGLYGEIMELHPGGLWLDSGGPIGRTWFPAHGVGNMAYADPPRG